MSESAVGTMDSRDPDLSAPGLPGHSPGPVTNYNNIAVPRACVAGAAEVNRVHAMLVTFVEKLTRTLGDIAIRERPPNSAIPLEQWKGQDFLPYIDRLRAATADDFLGLGDTPCPPGTSVFLYELMARCVNLRDALECGFKFLRFVTTAIQIDLQEEDKTAAIIIRQTHNKRDPERALSDWQLIVWHKMSQFLTGTELVLLRSEFAHSLDASYSAYASMLGGECIFNCADSRLVFNRSELDKLVVVTKPDARKMIANTHDYFTSLLQLTMTWSQSVKNILRAQLRQGSPLSNQEQLAEKFGVSGQTLRRHLRREGSSYRTLKLEARREQALDVFGDSNGSVADASFAAGFADATALTRALKTSRGPNTQQLREKVDRWKQPKATPPVQQTSSTPAHKRRTIRKSR